MADSPKIHLLDANLTRTMCGLDALELPREQVTGFSRKATCLDCKRASIDQMYRNYEENTRPPIRRV